MPNPLTIVLGRLVQAATKARGGGTALPGLIVERIEPDFAVNVLERLPLGVVLVSGTNGKTTTVKIVTEVLEATGLRVFTNNTGSNFMRGVISSLLRKVKLNGRLDADIAVLELDEAHAVNFVQAIKPRYALLLNVMADQPDRFGEIDHTAQLLQAVAESTTGVVVLNREDSRLAAIPAQHGLTADVRWFGLAPAIRSEFYEEAVDSEMAAVDEAAEEPPQDQLSPALLSSFDGTTATFEIDNVRYQTALALKGLHNAYNAAAALALCHSVAPDAPLDTLVQALATVRSAFGRGESVTVGTTPVELILVKNPDGFRLALKSFDSRDSVTMITMSDEYGDGRDISWLYDVDFSSLKQSGVAMASGSRAYDLALRLEYDEVPFKTVEPDLSGALDAFLANSPAVPHRIYCSYTTMLELRKLLASKTAMEHVV